MTNRFATPLEAHNWLSTTPGANESLIGDLIATQMMRSAHSPGTRGYIDAQQRLADTMRRVEEDRDRVLAENREALMTRPPMDIPAGSGTCGCEPMEPCCITQVTLGCAHASGRMTLPLADPDAKRILTLVADQGPNPGSDTLHVSVATSGPSSQCIMESRQPVVAITGHDYNNIQSGTALSIPLMFRDNADLGHSDLQKFINGTGSVIFGDIEDTAARLSFQLHNCSGSADFDAQLMVYPKIEWASAGFGYEIKGTYFTNGTFVPSIKFGGEISGKYCGTEWSVGASVSHSPVPQGHSRSIIPFLDQTMSRLTSATSGGSRRADNTTNSSIEVSHVVALGNSKFTIAEHPTDHAKVGIDGKIEIGFDPLLGINATIDIFDVLLTAASTTGAGAPLAAALQKARTAAARGVGSPDGPAQLSAHAAITLTINGKIGRGGVTLTRKPGDDHWEGSGEVSGSLTVRVRGAIEVEGRLYQVRGDMAAQAQANSSIEATLKTLTKSEQEVSNGKKFNLRIKWDGIRVSYSARAQMSGPFFNARAQESSGEITVINPQDLYNGNF